MFPNTKQCAMCGCVSLVYTFGSQLGDFASMAHLSMSKGKDTQGAIDFAVAASCLKHSIEHDFNLVKVKDVEALAAGNGTGRVQR